MEKRDIPTGAKETLREIALAIKRLSREFPDKFPEELGDEIITNILSQFTKRDKQKVNENQENKLITVLKSEIKKFQLKSSLKLSDDDIESILEMIKIYISNAREFDLREFTNIRRIIQDTIKTLDIKQSNEREKQKRVIVEKSPFLKRLVSKRPVIEEDINGAIPFVGVEISPEYIIATDLSSNVVWSSQSEVTTIIGENDNEIGDN